MADDSDSKTEQPTQRRLSKAHDEGNLYHSQEVKTAAIIIGGLVLVWGLANPLLSRIDRMLSGFYERADSIRFDTVDSFTAFMASVAGQLALIMAIPFGMFVVIALAATIMQTGFVFTTEKLGFDFERINPLAGAKRMFSQQALVELVKNLVKLTVVGAIGMFVVYPQFKLIAHLPALDTPAVLEFLHSVVSRLLLAIALIVVIIAGADWFYQRFAYIRRMRMTKQEVKDEQKQTEGDPMVKARLRALRMQRARQRMMAAVPKADVVITNPTHYACALKYDMESMGAPVLVAKGQELVALRIRQIAQEHDVPIVENPPLARALYATVDLDKEIPPQHYKAVAEVISYVFRLKGKLRK
jgi:flagellar biosynthetic protein FlhB